MVLSNMCRRVIFFCFWMMVRMVGEAQQPERNDILITELMADPSPVVGLPNVEWIELHNRSATTVNLAGWRLGDGTLPGVITGSLLLQPDSFLVLCGPAALPQLLPFGRCAAMSGFPSLDNDGDVLSLQAPTGKTIHAVPYTLAWYGSAVKREGGWSLEMIDIDNPCSGAGNWSASRDRAGGTPARANSVDGVNKDVLPPRLLRSVAADSVTVILHFNETLDSLTASNPSGFTFDARAITVARPLPPLFESVQLRLSVPMQQETVYRVTVSGVTDCAGNSISAFNTTPAGLFAQPAAGDVVINEILFDPVSGGSDYVEIYNRGKGIYNAAHLLLAGRSPPGTLVGARKLSEVPLALFPGNYLVATEDKVNLQASFFVKDPAAVVQLSALPSLPDDKGVVVVTDIQGLVIDEVSYSRQWHFGLISDPEGVSLERIDPRGPSGSSHNWHSAATGAGWGTPGYQNSQFGSAARGGSFAISPPVFSPDNDGRDDFVTLLYAGVPTGYTGNVTVFNAAGIRVRQLVRNALLARDGFWTWDGLGEGGKPLPGGTYVVWAEFFNLDGKRERFKEAVVLVD